MRYSPIFVRFSTYPYYYIIKKFYLIYLPNFIFNLTY